MSTHGKNDGTGSRPLSEKSKTARAQRSENSSAKISMPNGLSFVDTNILVYRAKAVDQRKWKIATELCATVPFGLSTQVLQEFYVAAVHPKKLNLSHADALAIVEALFEFPLHVIDQATIQHALVIKQRYTISYWDAAVIASAKALECSVIFTEDLNHGQVYDGVRASNPFA